MRQRPAWLRNQTRWAVYCAGVLFLAGFVWIQVREQRLATWIRPQELTAASAVEPWAGHMRDGAATNFTVVTISTKASRELELLQASCPHAVHVLGVGQRYEKYRSKVTLLFDELMYGPRVTRAASMYASGGKIEDCVVSVHVCVQLLDPCACCASRTVLYHRQNVLFIDELMYSLGSLVCCICSAPALLTLQACIATSKASALLA